MNSFFGNFWKAGLPFAIAMTIVFAFSYDWMTGSISGILSGIFFGVAIAAFIAYQEKKFTSDRPLKPDEKLIKEGRANHFYNGEGVGGWIYLTDSRFFFKSHSSNIQNHALTIPLREIDFVEQSKTFGIIPNQLTLTLRDGQVEKFVVSGAKDWVATLKNLI
jgi:GRAM domain